ncbi:Ig-like domain-containing protein [Aureliella helgolandensis]|uniref:HYDIN/VesB/CFA65-like Ig-like domain-containing protein n=1 Tax=Aureliella helgolandensis TaxID=2527968 RepID=A0A518GCB2_9BACT|nr:DUF1573 domain-containing protein [Aureliella helgolandensis]QDV26228.1 hypothetical protein Q31a_46000 [Aureliella helgolandensis]
MKPKQSMGIAVNRFFEILSVVLGSAGVSLLCVFWWGPGSPPSVEQVLALNTKTLDFGLLSIQQPGAQTLEITNRSGEPMDFRIEFDCNCTTATPPTGQIAAGQIQTVDVTFLPVATNQGNAISSASHECIVNFRTSQLVASQAVELVASLYTPVLWDSARAKLRSEALLDAPFQIDLTLASDVERIEVISSPEFLEIDEVSAPHPTFHAVSLRGTTRSGTEVGTKEGKIVLRAFPVHSVDHDAADLSVFTQTIHLSLTHTTTRPFRLSRSMLESEPGIPSRLAAIPSPHMQSAQIQSATCSDDSWELSIGDSGELVATPQVMLDDEQSDPAVYCKLKVLCVHLDSHSEIFECHITLYRKEEVTPTPRESETLN